MMLMLITKLQTIDPTTGAAIGEFHSGDTLYNSTYPHGYNIAVQFSGGFRAAQFAVDGLPPVTQMAPPYIVSDKHPIKPLNLAVGPHQIGVIVDGQQLPDIKLIVAAAPPVIVPAKTTILCPPGGNATIWDASASGRTLANAIIDSLDGNGFAGNVHGAKVTISNVDLKNLNEGFDYVGCTDLTIEGGGQIGKVAGRCHYFIDVKNLNWTGDPNKVLGPASTQSPVRSSSPGIRGGRIVGIRVTQAGSPFPIACFAWHALDGVNIDDCVAIGGEFSFNSAGVGLNDAVVGCTITNLTTINTKVSLSPIASNNHFVGGKFSNPTGECVSLSCGPGNVFDGVELHSQKHGFHFYAPSNAIIKNCTLFAPAGTPIMDGACTKANNGGGNRLVVTP
jgi:hypothetical protein